MIYIETHAGDDENIANKKPLAGSQVSGVPAASTAHKVKNLEHMKLIFHESGSSCRKMQLD